MDPEAASPIRTLHAGVARGSRDKLLLLPLGWLGGPQRYVEKYGHPRLRARHLPFPIGVVERDQWLKCMSQAMVDREVDGAARAPGAAFFGTADWMRNQAG